MPTESIQNYLKAIYRLSEEGRKVTTSALARELGIAPASATLMIKRLADRDLVVHEPYRGVALSEEGERIAVEMVRHHRLVERFLVEVLGVPWDEVHDEAEKWEHLLSEDIERRMDAALGFPTSDPHGSPIPSYEGAFAEREAVPMADLRSGQSAVVAEVSDRDASLLRYVGSLGLYPGAEVSVVDDEPRGGTLTILVGRKRHTIGRDVARELLVSEVAG